MARLKWTDEELDAVLNAYLSTALWSSTTENEDGETGTFDTHGYGVDDLSDEFVTQAREDVNAFYRTERTALTPYMSPDEAGHLFWLTRNRHGAGFWDKTYHGAAVGHEYYNRMGITRDEARYRVRFNRAMERLTACSHAYGSVDLYVGDDGKVYGQ